MEQFFKNHPKTYQSIWILLLGFCLFSAMFIIDNSGHPGDIGFWTHWAMFLKTKPFAEIYQINCDYMPMYLYVLKVYGIFQNTPSEFFENIHFLKAFSFIFDILTAYFIAHFMQKHLHKIGLFIVLILFVPFSYNSLVWAQIDSIFAFFCAIALFCWFKEKYHFAIPILIIAINIKLQSILIIPVLFLMFPFINLSPISPKLKSMCIGIFLAITIQFIVLFPFIQAKELSTYFAAILHPFKQETTVSFAAANFWFLFTGSSLYEIATYKTDTLFLKISLKTIGYLLLLTSLLPLLLLITKLSLKKIVFSKKSAIKIGFLVSGLFCLLCFFFLTGMHERYAHLAIILLSIAAAINKKPLLILLLFFPYFLNLEIILNRYHWVQQFSILSNLSFIALIYLAIIIISYTALIIKLNTFLTNNGVKE